MTAMVDNAVADIRRANAELQRRLDEALAERDEALDQQTATAEVLQVINSSPGDLAPVFEAMLEKALGLCGAAFGHLWTFDGECFQAATSRGGSEDYAALLSRERFRAPPGTMLASLEAGSSLVHIADVAAEEAYQTSDAAAVRALLELGRARTVVGVPLRRDGTLLGVISVYRQEVRPLADKQIALLENFAAQAVIAIENTRLITETREALDQQTATAEVLGVINSSPGDLTPVFEVILDKAHALCGAERGTLFLYDGIKFKAAVAHGYPEDVVEYLRGGIDAAASNPRYAPLFVGKRVHIPDLSQVGGQTSRIVSGPGGVRTNLLVPLIRDGVLLGMISCNRTEVRPFSDKEIALIENFAAQAVIAIDNARLLGELRERTSDLEESLEYQTATSDVLKVISRSTFDLQPVLDTLVQTAARLCSADNGSIATRDGEVYRVVANFALAPEWNVLVRTLSFRPGRDSVTGRTLLERQVIQIADITADPEYTLTGAATVGNMRTVLGVPLLREGAPIGVMQLSRTKVEPFSERQIELVRTFADQAVIAIENARLITETREALEQQTATAEVLEVINSSPGDLAPVFDAMLEKAMRLCEASIGAFYSYDGEFLDKVAHRGNISAEHIMQTQHVRVEPGGNFFRLIQGETIVHVADLKETEMYRSGFRRAVDMVDIAGARTAVWVGLRRDETLLGILVIYRQEVRPFTDKQIALLQNFAAQAVIAMENARLITETREALDQQTATAEVLQVINSSPGDLAPVFDAMLEKAVRLLNADFGILWRFENGLMRLGASYNVAEAFIEHHREPMRPGPESGPGRMMRGGSGFITANFLEFPPYLAGDPAVRSIVELAGARSAVIAPLRKDGAALGSITVYRKEVKPFSEKQLAVLENFAAQAVIAMENARLITETQEALDQQTATAEVLQVINASPGDLAPVFDAMLEKAMRLCEAAFGILMTFNGDRFEPAAQRGLPVRFAQYLATKPDQPAAGGGQMRVLSGEHVVQFADMKDEEAYRDGTNPLHRAMVDLGGARAGLVVPLCKDDAVIGTFTIYRHEVRPFSDKQIALLQNFAAQAVIAMENARLLGELRERTGDLEESLEYQTATSDVLKVISNSTFNLQPVLDTLLQTAARLCQAEMGGVAIRSGEVLRYVATTSINPAFDAFLHARPFRADRSTMAGRVASEGQVVQIVDAAADAEYQLPELLTVGGIRTLLGVPLLREGEPVGVITLCRQNVEPFTERQVDLVRTFADQAVIAIENARLITETREARDDAQTALGDLKAAQANLIQAEKMASLGQLTAGIAHEIKNPLNFVNNFASLSVELLDELKETTASAIAALGEDKRAEVGETIDMLSGNLEKISAHGKRADNIVKSMLEHSRGVSGERREVDLNGLIEEALNLAYHGARAQDQGFNITLERAFDPALAQIELAPQEMTRVFLNLFGNGFYAANKRVRENGDGAFRPILTVTTRDLGDAVEVRVRDNGTGIPPDSRDKLFQPFFTTKPTGEGTGLGLSISYDIVTQQHGGTIEVDSEEGVFTEFTIRLPRTQPAVAR